MVKPAHLCPPRGERWLVAVAILLAATGFLLATQHMSHSVWFDESQTHLISRQNTFGEMTRLARTVRPYPPLYFLASHYSLRLRDDEIGLRVPAALFGSLAVFAVFLLGRKLVDGPTGVIAAALFLLTPGAFRYFVDGNPYTLLMLASALSTLYLIKAAASDRAADWLLYALFALLGLGTHTLFLFHFGAQFLAGLYLKLSARPPGKISCRRLFTVTSVLFAAVSLWTLNYMRGESYVRTPHLSRLPEFGTLVTLAGMYVGPLSFGSLALLVLWGTLQLLGAAALFSRYRNSFWLLAILVAAPLAGITLFVKSTLPYVAYRYCLGLFPLTCIVAACSWRALSGRALLTRAAAGVAIIGYCASGAVFILQAGETVFGYQDWRGAVRYLRQHSAPGEVVMVTASDRALPLGYYYKAPVAVATTAGQIAALAEGNLKGTSAGDRTAWVLCSNFANEKPLAARYTEFRKLAIKEPDDELPAALAQRGLAISRTVRFQRVTLLAIRRQP
jgi:4-amino-4-deoxy-L-arabinose transferase-like glycosyltransferase